MTVHQYIDSINKRFMLGYSTEHTFRGDLQQLIETIVPDIRATNEPKRQACGAPDYILTKGEIPVGFIEAKDIDDKDISGVKKTGNKEQFDRYKASLNNLIFTDYLNFLLYREGEFITKITIGEITDKGIKPMPENFLSFENLIKDFSSHVGQTIKSSKKLAEMMAGKARLLSDIIGKALTSDVANQENSTLKDQMTAFKQILIHNITPQGFADVYAQTIAYGMFAARLHDPTLGTFTRQEAAELIPKSNPFLRKLFGYIAGPDIDDRIKWVVDSLADIFLACNVENILKNYGKSTKMEDPIIHFYETFLSQYDPKLRKSRGVWYTPQPVVNFIVRAVDDILKTEFDLPQGLADTSKTTIKVNTQTEDKRSATGYKQVDQEVHRVQILDPATGTGTFLAEVVKHIHKKFEGQQGIWSNYIERHLLPRLNGFELLMASYAMAHLKLDLLLTETGYNPTTNQRLRVYLTNSLEEHHQDTGTLFASWLSSEANEANHIKRDTPVMCIIGNPPYSGESANKGDWIMGLMEDYKKEPGGKEKLKERNPKWINDDYVKFLRYGQHFIEKNGSGVLAFINPHGFLDNPTFRGMRWHLLKTYDKIYTLDLHGNSKKKETSLDGSPDINVFDIQQGVSINLFVKTGKKKPNELGKIFHYDLFGKREFKYDFLIENSLNTISYKELPKVVPNYFFTSKDFDELNKYNESFPIDKLFVINSAGIVTARDEFTIHFTKDEVRRTVEEFINIDDEGARIKFNLGKDVRDWTVAGARKDLINSNLDFSCIVRVVYRPFEFRFTYFTGTTKGFHCMPRGEVMKHLFKKNNIGLISPKQVPDKENSGVYISNTIAGHKTCSAYNINNIFPLYLYPETKGQQNIDQSIERTPNLKEEIVNQIADKLDLDFTNEKEINNNTFAPIDILDYIYAVLHSPTYREKYKEFLKIDFPRVPYPKDADTFWKLVDLGGHIRQIHLLESPLVDNYITQYPIDGNNEVVKPIYKEGRVYINDSQYFDQVPDIAWSFYIGGYQPAQKWLKDRKGRELGFEDILHYQKIIVALTETDRLMKEIDMVNFL
ncbi:type ISP restriction/modification enzyme [Cyclobacterium plantarum]|uniref:type ISP restriction/modification enzyme n=1 Tax=Cyclobacterium plantarum TaxID=2716263 RepID=UPI003F71F5BA